MSAPDEALLSLLSYRMYAISIGRIALRYHMSWDEIPDMEIFFDGRDVPAFEGKATGFTNASIEAAIIHCRAVLEFLGLCYSNPNSQIAQIRNRNRDDDLGIERIDGLAMVSKADAVAAMPASQEDAETALTLIFHAANKGLAHSTSSFDRDSAEARFYLIAFEGIPALLRAFFYTPLEIPVPPYEISSRSADSYRAP